MVNLTQKPRFLGHLPKNRLQCRTRHLLPYRNNRLLAEMGFPKERVEMVEEIDGEEGYQCSVTQKIPEEVYELRELDR